MKNKSRAVKAALKKEGNDINEQRNFNVEILIAEYQQAIYSYLNENIQLKALLKESENRESALKEELEQKNIQDFEVVEAK